MNPERSGMVYGPLGLAALATLAVIARPNPHGGLEVVLLLLFSWMWAVTQMRARQEARRALRETVSQLNETVERWASGDLNARVYLDHEDPLDSLAHGMNQVAEVLAERSEDLREDKERLETILASMANGIIIFGHGLTITLINQAARVLFGINEPDVVGRHLLEVLRDVGLEDIISTVTRSGQTLTREWSPGDDDPSTLEITVAPLKQPVGGLGAVMVARDISSQKQVDQMRADFVANVSHELQTPLTIIRGFTETLLDEKDPLAARRFIHLIHEEGTRMSRLVDDLLTLSRMEHHSLPVKTAPVDVAVLVDSLLGKLARRLGDAELTARTSFPEGLPLASGDPDLLAEVFLNLITNAIQYTPAGGRITVSARLHPSEPWIGVEVADTGIGIPPGDLPRIFERFYRVDRARSRASGGTGLGLAIVKHIMELHHGRVEVKSQVGEGTQFTAWIPLYNEGTA